MNLIGWIDDIFAACPIPIQLKPLMPLDMTFPTFSPAQHSLRLALSPVPLVSFEKSGLSCRRGGGQATQSSQKCFDQTRGLTWHFERNFVAAR
jgi:hypothetical protein